MVPGGAAEPWGGNQGGHQTDAVQDGGQLPDGQNSFLGPVVSGKVG